MKSIVSGFCVAFSLYSAIPMPKTEWNKNTMKYALCFLPLVGALVGALELAWLYAATRLSLSEVLYGAVAALLPVAVTGGIHLDGFTDTADALCSFADREKRLAILKDPHVGAFGVMYLAGLLLLQAGLYAQFFRVPQLAAVLAVGFVFARTIGGGAVVWLPCAKDSGLARTFADGSARRSVRLVLLLEALLCLLLVAARSAWCAAALGVLCAVLLPLFRKFCLRVFGGVTGDLAGFSITLAETIILLLCTVGGLLLRGQG